MMNSLKLKVFIFLFFLQASASLNASVVQNGDFENGLANWSVSRNSDFQGGSDPGCHTISELFSDQGFLFCVVAIEFREHVQQAFSGRELESR